jgi:hypothetical protein
MKICEFYIKREIKIIQKSYMFFLDVDNTWFLEDKVEVIDFKGLELEGKRGVAALGELGQKGVVEHVFVIGCKPDVIIYLLIVSLEQVGVPG